MANNMKLFQRIADWATNAFGTPQSLGFHLLWWTIWFSFHIEHPPYGELTLIVSLEAIILAILILNSSTHQGEKDRSIINEDLKLDNRTHKLVEEIWKKVAPGEELNDD